MRVLGMNYIFTRIICGGKYTIWIRNEETLIIANN